MASVDHITIRRRRVTFAATQESSSNITFVKVPQLQCVVRRACVTFLSIEESHSIDAVRMRREGEFRFASSNRPQVSCIVVISNQNQICIVTESILFTNAALDLDQVCLDCIMWLFLSWSPDW